MKKQYRLAAILTFIAICVCAFIFLRYFVGVVMNTPIQMNPLYDPPTAWGHDYKIEPESILADIGKGKTDIFQISDEGRSEPKYPSGSFAWSSADYLAIAKAHHLYLTGEPASGEWKLFAPGYFYIYQCRDNMRGFDGATIIFYKRNPDSFPVTYIDIFPLRNYIYSDYLDYTRDSYDDNWLAKILFDPDNVYEEALPIEGPMNAELALQIAEESGGAEMRHRLSSDRCQVDIKYNAEKWGVKYYWLAKDLTYTLSFDIRTDGRYKKRENLELCERTICP